MSRSINNPKGFRFSGIVAGIKETGKKDLALIVSEVPAVAVGLFTSSLAPAAPVELSRRVLRTGSCQAILVNSGNANACTGARGLKDAARMQRETARLLGIEARRVAVCSTGKIGVPLPIDKMSKVLPRAVQGLAPKNFLQAAQAILTTDQFVKIGSFTGQVRGKKYSLLGFAKGAGMIEPHMKTVSGLHATMLAYFLTDLEIERKVLQPIFARAVELSFNRITVDGDMSTNDTAILLANGQAGNGSVNARELVVFERELTKLMQQLACDMVRDGEGATKVVRIEVRGAKSDGQARQAAYAIGNSPLVKTAFYGSDPNWGRIVGAAARAGVAFDPDKVSVAFDSVVVARNGLATPPPNEKKAHQVMARPRFSVTVDFHLGTGSHWIWASDLTHGYVTLNAHYRT